MLIGNDARPGDTVTLHHSPDYDFNDDAGPLGVAYWSRLAERMLPRRR